MQRADATSGDVKSAVSGADPPDGDDGDLKQYTPLNHKALWLNNLKGRMNELVLVAQAIAALPLDCLAVFPNLDALHKAIVQANKRFRRAYQAGTAAPSAHVHDALTAIMQAEQLHLRYGAELVEARLVAAEAKEAEGGLHGGGDKKDETSADTKKKTSGGKVLSVQAPSKSIKAGGRLMTTECGKLDKKITGDELQELLDLLRQNPSNSLFADTTKTKRLRHDLQNYKTYKAKGFLNYQIQVGGSELYFKDANTSLSLVVVDLRLVDGMDEKTLLELLVKAHIQSLRGGCKVILTFDDKAGRAFVSHHSAGDT